MYRQTLARSMVVAATLSALCLYAIYGGYFAREIVIEIAILAILAVSLDMVAGFGGMVSLCHGAVMGLAAYVYAIFAVKWGAPAFPAALAAIAVAATFGTAVGWIAGRTTGIFFIMATLAFGQMVYTVIFKSRWLGGDDGMGGIQRFDLSWLGLEMNDSLTFALFAVFMLLLAYIAAAFVMRSGFGRVLIGIRSNEARMRAVGVDTIAHRAQAMGFSTLLAGVAGVLAAQHTQYIAPDLLHWTVSGEVLIIVILGGLGTLAGPVIGAAAFVLLKHEASNHTDYWHLTIGVLLIATVLSGGRGLYGQAEHVATARLQRKKRGAEADRYA